jgi:hypothetical protein
LPEYDEPVTEKKRGRQRSVLQAKNDVLLYRYRYNQWPSDLSTDMRSYYNVHYIRKDGDKHGVYVQYIREFQAENSAKFGEEDETEISPAQHSGKVVRFPTR